MNFAFSVYEARKTHFSDNLFSKIPKKLNFQEQETLSDHYSKYPKLQTCFLLFLFSTCAKRKRNGVC